MSASLADAIVDAHHGKKQMVQCPAHEDRQASLHVGPGVDHPVILHCHAECQTEDIIRAAGIDWTEVMTPRDTTSRPEWTPAGEASHIYDYVDENYQLLFQALRIPEPGGGKTFRQRRPDDSKESGWNWTLGDTRRVLYRLPRVLQAMEEGRTIYVVEGEKDVESLWMDGYVGTCNPMGALKWMPEFGKVLAGASVVILADADDKGREHARMVRDDLLLNGCDVTIRESALPGCKDYTDHRAKGGAIETMKVTFTSHPNEVIVGGIDLIEFIETDWDAGKEIIPGFFAEANVAIVTGFEGHGKSTLLRQIALCCAGGINPFTMMPMEPLRTMFIDAENPEHQQVLDWRRMAGLVARHGHPVQPGMLTILSEWRAEPDLLTVSGQSWFYERIQAYQPQLCLIGPVQNVVGRDVKDDEVVRKLKHAVNSARAICGTGFMLEHHSPHKASGDTERSVRPYGSSLFLKWPDFCYGMKPDKDEEGLYHMVANRKARVKARSWPKIARIGHDNTLEMPWVFEEDDLRRSTNEKTGDWSGRRGA